MIKSRINYYAMCEIVEAMMIACEMEKKKALLFNYCKSCQQEDSFCTTCDRL